MTVINFYKKRKYIFGLNKFLFNFLKTLNKHVNSKHFILKIFFIFFFTFFKDMLKVFFTKFWLWSRIVGMSFLLVFVDLETSEIRRTIRIKIAFLLLRSTANQETKHFSYPDNFLSLKKLHMKYINLYKFIILWLGHNSIDTVNERQL